jgi:hypothetical protein
MEGLWETQPYAPLTIAGWVDTTTQETHGLKILGQKINKF